MQSAYKTDYTWPSVIPNPPVSTKGTLAREGVFPIQKVKTVQNQSTMKYNEKFIRKIFELLSENFTQPFSFIPYLGQTLQSFQENIHKRKDIDATFSGWTLLTFISYALARFSLESSDENLINFIQFKLSFLLTYFIKLNAKLSLHDGSEKTAELFFNIPSRLLPAHTLYSLYYNKKNLKPTCAPSTISALAGISEVSTLLNTQLGEYELNLKDKHGRSQLFYAIFALGNVRMKNIIAILAKKPALAEESDNFSRYPLYYAYITNDSDVIDKIFDSSLIEIQRKSTLDYILDTEFYSMVHLRSKYQLESPLYNMPYVFRGQAGAGPKVERLAIFKSLCNQYGLDITTPDAELISQLFSKISLDNNLSETHKKTLLKKSNDIKETLKYYARQIKDGCHEMMNAATTHDFSIRVAVGEHKHMERVAKGKNDTEISISNLIEKQRIKTFEYVMKPKKVINLKNKYHTSIFFDVKNNSNKYVFHGHVGAGFFSKDKLKTKKDLVCTEGAATGHMHKKQIAAMNLSRHHLSLSRRLSKVTDSFQAQGEDILKAFDDGGFHKYSFVKTGPRDNDLKSAATPKSAYDIAVRMQFNYQKRRTNEKKIRAEYCDSDTSYSEDYTEISTLDEVSSSDSISFFEKKLKKDQTFKAFRTSNKL